MDNIKTYMQQVGRQARAASRTIALAETATKNRALEAIADAILGALGEGDIGKHFPDTDPAYKGADSVKLLAHVARLAGERGYRLGNLDATIIAQK